MPLDYERAAIAVGSLARQLNRSLEETAAGIILINNNNAATLIRQQTLERGYDTRNFVIYAFGGAGPLHAFGIGPELGINEIRIPLGNGASTLSAYGIASSPIVQFFERETRNRAPFDLTDLQNTIETAEQAALEGMEASGLDPTLSILERVALMRYAEQRMHSLDIPIPSGEMTEAIASGLHQAFDQEYARQYGQAARVLHQTAEIFAVRVRATQSLGFACVDSTRPATVPDPQLVQRARLQNRMVFWPTRMNKVDTAIYDGRMLPMGASLDGPLIIELPHTSVVVDQGQNVEKDSLGSLTIRIRQ
jgi:N-methylhydantoinase A